VYGQSTSTGVSYAQPPLTSVSYGQLLVHLQPQAMANPVFTNYPHPLSSNSGQQYPHCGMYDEEETNECYSYKNCSKD
jgi:hypothetical protein